MTNQTTSPPNLPRGELIALMAGFMSLNAFALDIMLPALPDIAASLNAAAENQQQWVLSIFLFGFGFGQMFFGPLSDSFGRRNLLVLGVTIYVAAAILAVYSPSFSSLLLFRFAQGIGSAATRVVIQSIIRDLFKGNAMAEVLSLVLLVFTIVPVIAPSLGQLILLTGEWHNIFWFMGLMGTVTLVWALIRLPETLALKDRRAFNPTSIWQGFATVFSNRISMGYIFAGSFSYAVLITFIFTAEQVFVDIYNLGNLFTFAFGTIATSMALSSFLNSRVVNRFGTRRIAHAGLIILTISSAVMLILSLIGPVPLLVYMGLLAISMFTFGQAFSNITSLALTPLGKVAGSASAVLGTIQTLLSTAMAAIVGQFFNGTIVPIALGMTLFGIGAVAAVAFAENGKLFQRSTD